MNRTRDNWLTLLPLAVLVSVAGATYWRSELAMQEVQTHYRDATPSGPDYVLQGFESFEYNPQGQLMRIMRGERAAHEPRDDTYHIQGAALAVQHAPQRWSLVFAHRGVMYPNQQVDLDGGVLMRDWQGELAPDWSVRLAPSQHQPELALPMAGDWVRSERLRWRDPISDFEGGVQARFTPLTKPGP